MAKTIIDYRGVSDAAARAETLTGYRELYARRQAEKLARRKPPRQRTFFEKNETAIVASVGIAAVIALVYLKRKGDSTFTP
jgi:hypothetical protein